MNEEQLASSLGFPMLGARLLIARGLDTPEAYQAWTSPPASLPSPDELPDLTAAERLIQRVIRAGRRLRVCGDYDCDGVTATAIMVRTLRHLGADVDWRIPNRFDEGYGLSAEAVFQAAQDGVGCLVTVDCGSSSADAGRLADSLGLPLIITDHHRLGIELPPAAAHVNPERMPETGRQILCGAGVALQLARALLPEVPDTLWALAALGTVADVMPLVGASRIIVRRGLLAMERGGLPAISALLPRHEGPVDAETLAYQVAPRINAAGRMGRPDPAVELCLTDHAGTAREWGLLLEEANQERRALEAQVLAQALRQVGAAYASGGLPAFIVVAGEGWHEGVVGIVAGRLAERLGRPAAVIALQGTTAKGSARLRGPGDLLAVLRLHAEKFTKLGGHRAAAGFSLSRSAVAGLGDLLSTSWRAAMGDQPPASDRPDVVCGVEELTSEVAALIRSLGPFGQGFPPFRLQVHGEVEAWRPMGQDGRHVRIRFRGQPDVEHVAFGVGPRLPDLAGRRLTGVVSVEPHVWRGTTTWQARWRSWSFPERHGGRNPTARLVRVAETLEPPAEGGGLILVGSQREVARLAWGGNVRRLTPQLDAAELEAWALDAQQAAAQFYVASWWRPLSWEGPPLPALWVLAPPPHRWAYEAALAFLAPDAPVYWSREAADGGALVTTKWDRLVPEREALLRLWRARTRGASPFLPGAQILRDLGLWESPRAGGTARQPLTASVHYRTAQFERERAVDDWRRGIVPWEED